MNLHNVLSRHRWAVVVGAMALLLATTAAACGSDDDTGQVADTGASAQAGAMQATAMQSAAPRATDGIWVTGAGSVGVAPDIAVLSLGVESRDASVTVALGTAADAMDRIIAGLIEAGVLETDIQTTQFSVSPAYEWNALRSTSEFVGYDVTNIVNVTIRDLDDVGPVIDRAAQAGGDMTRVRSVSFSVEDPGDEEIEARDLAVKSAMTQAQQLAAAAGVTLGEAVSIETYASAPVSNVDGIRMMSAMESSFADTPIRGGELDIEVSVRMGFEIA